MNFPYDALPPSAASWRRSLRWSQAAAVVLLAVAAGMIVGESLLHQVGMEMQLNYVEGFIVDDALRIARGAALYGDPRHQPFVVSVYTPLYPVLVAVLARGGLDGFLAGRVLTLAAILGTAIVVAASGKRRTGAVAVVVALLFLLDPLQFPWSVVVRPDALAALFSMVAVVIVAGSGEGRAVWWAVPALVAAIFTKQSALAAPAAVVVVLLSRRPRTGLLFAIALGGSVVGLAAIAQVATAGQFLFHTVVANANPFELGRVVSLWASFLRGHALEAVVLVLLLFRAAWQRRVGIVSVYAAFAWLAALGVGKVGSDSNYFLEPVAAVALLVAHEFPPTLVPRCPRARASLGVALLLGVVVMGGTRAAWHLRVRAPLSGANQVFRGIATSVASVNGAVVSDDAGVVVRAGKQVFFQPFVMTQLAEAGLWDQTPFLEALGSGGVRLVIVQTEPAVVYESRYTPQMRAVLRERFTVVANYILGFRYAILKPVGEGGGSVF